MAKRQVFFSFHFDKDIWRVGQVRNIGAVDGQEIFFDNGWEKVRLKSDTAIKAWIDSEMRMRSCIVVLIGTDTASRRWVQYEIEQAWRLGKGVVGIYIHGLEDYWGRQASKGHNPFDDFYIDRQINYISHRSTPLDDNDVLMSAVCKAYDPPYVTSKVVYQDIKDNIEKLIEETARKERSKRKGVSVQKVRSILNVVFMLCAVAGLILYFAWPDNRLAGMAVIGAGMCFKIIEFFLRFLF